MQRFSPLQKLLLDEVLKGDSHLLKQLDPSRSRHSEGWWEWHSADEDIRFSHVKVSRTFLHGHPGLALSDLVAQLVANPRDSESIPALVAVKGQGVLHVIMGNRRLKCYKEALKKGRNCFLLFQGHRSWVPCLQEHFGSCFAQRFQIEGHTGHEYGKSRSGSGLSPIEATQVFSVKSTLPKAANGTLQDGCRSKLQSIFWHCTSKFKDLVAKKHAENTRKRNKRVIRAKHLESQNV